MAKEAEKKLVRVIESLADEIKDGVKADDALKYTQAALNAANTIQTLKKGI